MSYTEILELAKQLPDEEFFQLKSEMDKTYSEKRNKEKKKEEILKLLSECPVMTDEQYQEFLEDRKHFNEWTAK